jgi:hypothetical protein
VPSLDVFLLEYHANASGKREAARLSQADEQQTVMSPRFELPDVGEVEIPE